MLISRRYGMGGKRGGNRSQFAANVCREWEDMPRVGRSLNEMISLGGGSEVLQESSDEILFKGIIQSAL